MSIQDRDYYRDHWRKQRLEELGQERHMPKRRVRHEPLRPPRSSNRSLLAIAVAVAAVLALAYAYLPRKVSGQVEMRVLRSAPASTPLRDSIAPISPPKVPAPSSGALQPGNPSPAPRVQQVTKCVSAGGATSYSDSACPSGARGGALFVRPDDNLANGMSPQARAASSRSNSAAAQYVLEQERRVASNVSRADAECAHLNAQIAALDAAARQPLSGFEQDNLRDRRKKVRDRQFALRCG